LARGQVRGPSLCALISGAHTVSNWSGIVKTVDSNGDGKCVLAVLIADDVSVTTWNNDLSDFRDHTLIEPESLLFDAVSKKSAIDRTSEWSSGTLAAAI
jgi:hypothetical protein